MTTRIFTKRFFEASHLDQVQIVDAAVAALEEVIGRTPDRRSRQQAKRMLRRLERKAVKYGIYQAYDGEVERDQGDVPSNDDGRGELRQLMLPFMD